MIHPEQKQALVQAAIDVRHRAYVPYSGYAVGAALLSNNGGIFTGCNVENAAYSPTICAERTALVKAISDGVREFQAVAVVTTNAGSPCGVCRQVLFEFAPELYVIIANAEGVIKTEIALNDLLPLGFGPNSLE